MLDAAGAFGTLRSVRRIPFILNSLLDLRSLNISINFMGLVRSYIFRRRAPLNLRSSLYPSASLSSPLIDMDASEDEEETILEYAEYHKLATNCIAEESPDAELSILQESLKPLNLDDFNLYQIRYTAPKVPEPRLTLDKDAALILRSVNQHRDEPDPWKEISRHCKTTRRNGKKIDLPLLKTDSDADLAKFKARVSVQLKPEDEFLPSEPLDDEKDEGLAWRSHMYGLPAAKMAELDHEKLTISKPDIVFVIKALRDDWESKDNEEQLESQHTYRRVRVPLHPAAENILLTCPRALRSIRSRHLFLLSFSPTLSLSCHSRLASSFHCYLTQRPCLAPTSRRLSRRSSTPIN